MALLPPVVVRLMGDMSQLAATTAAATRDVDNAGRRMRASGAAAFNGLAKMGKGVSILAVGVAVESVKMAATFEQQTNLLVTAAGEHQANLGKVRDGILSISKETGTNWHALTEGMYQAEKAGFDFAHGGLTVLKTAAQGAREEGANLNTVVGAMTTIMQNYHMPATQSVQVMNALKTAAGGSKTTLELFAGSLSTVLPIAATSKISFQDIAGSLAVMTRQGETAAHGTQLMANSIRNLAAPNNVARKTMQQLGIDSVDVAKKLGQRGLSGTMNYLTEMTAKNSKGGMVVIDTLKKSGYAAQDAQLMLGKMSGSLKDTSKGFLDNKVSLGDFKKYIKSLPSDQAAMASQFMTLVQSSHGFSDQLKAGNPQFTTFQDQIKKMTGGANGLQTALELTGQHSGDVSAMAKKVGDSIHHASGDVEGWDSTSKLLSVRLDKMKATAQALMIEIGMKLIPVVTSVIDWFGKHKDVSIALAGVIAGILTLSVVAFAAKLAISAAQGVASMVKLGVSAVQAGARVVQGFRSAQVAGSAFSGASGTFGGILRKGFDGAVQGAKAAGGAVKGFAASVARVSASAGRAAWAGMVSGIQSVGVAMKAAAVQAMAFTRSMAASAVAGIRTAAAWVAQKVALIATTIAEKAAAVAQWALNIAMDANPIMLIVLAVAALVAGLIYAYTHFTWFKNGVDAAFHAISVGAMFVINFVKAHWQLIVVLITGPIGLAVLLVIKYWGVISRAFSAAISWCTSFVRAHWPLLVGILTGPIGLAAAMIIKYWGKISSAFSSAYQAVVGTGAKLIGWVKGLPDMVLQALGDMGMLLYQSGAKMMNGLIQGIKDKIGSVKDAASSALSAVRDYLPFSPAKKGPFSGKGWTLHSGRALMQGLADGITGGTGTVIASMLNVATATHATFANELQIASPSKKFRALGGYVMAGLVSGLTGSTARVRAATEHIARALYTNLGSGYQGLQRTVARDNAALMSLAKARDSVASRLAATQKTLSALWKSWTAERDSVSASIMQSASITTSAPDGREVNSFDVVQHMRDQVAAAAQFSASLNQLQKRGLRTDLIQQLAAAGADQAGATAKALSAASNGQIAEMNNLQNGLKSAADGTGIAVANAMYGAGIKSAQGLVKGLQSQEKAIEAQMMRIAKSMQTAIRRALGIHSPSRVFEALGQFIPQGLAKGIHGGAHHATNAVTALAGSVVGAGAFGARGLGIAGAAAGGGTIVHNHLTVRVEGSVVTEKKLVDVVQQGFLRLAMRNPQTYQPYTR